MPERPAELDSPLLSAKQRRLLLVAVSAALAYFCWFLLGDGDSLKAQERHAAALAISHPVAPQPPSSH